MATPQESITTVNGRRCTRSRARTAATSIFSSEAAVVTPTEVTSSALTSEQQQRLETTAPDIPPQAAQPAPAQESTEEQQQAVAPSTQQAAASSAIGTQSVVPTPTPIAQQQATQLADTPLPFPPPPPPPTEPLPAVLEEPAPAEATQTEAVVSAAAEITTTAPTTTSTQSTSSNPTIETAVSSSSPSTSRSSVIISSTFAIPSEPTAPVESSIQSSIPALPEGPAQSLIPTTPSPGEEEQPQPQPQPPDSAESEFPSSGSAGIISPEEGSLDGVGGLTIPANGQASIGSIVGGVVGGFVGIALISALLFLCLRKRRSRGFQKWNEKAVRRSAWKDKLRAIPAGFGMFFAKLKGKKTGPAENPYSRHTARSSISSVYSQGSNGHNRSMSEPPKQQSFAGRILSIKKSKNLLHKKQDSLVTGAKSPFPGIVEDPVVRNSKGLDDPFADPVEPPRTLLLLNPDQNDDDNRKTQQPRLTIPKPAAVPQRASRDPFQSILDELDERDGSGTPEWLKDSGHKRTTSAATALQSHPPSNYTASVYTLKDPFRDSQAPPVPTQPLPPNPPKQPGNMYGAGFPAFNATSTNASRDSNYSFFGEPGPSRPNTNMFTTSGRYGRQSDPFDLDRPEVLGFGNVTGRREVRASVTRQNSRSNRASSVPNWVSVEDGPYERASAVPGPLRNPSVRR